MPFWSRGKDKAKHEKIATAVTPEQGDAMIVEQLRQAGADLSKPRIVHHYLYFKKDAEATAQKVADQYGQAGLGVRLGESKDGIWNLRISHVMVVPSDDFREEKASIMRVAAAIDAEYDGWEAAVESWQPPGSS